MVKMNYMRKWKRPEGYGIADLHIHSSLVDGMASVYQILEYVECKTELDVIAITDHDDLRGSYAARELAARKKVPVVLMHMQGEPKTMQAEPKYDDVVREVTEYLVERARFAESFGVDREMIFIDPGIGFGKTVEHNLEIINRLQEFTGFEKPILLGHSRKSFIGKLLGGLPVTERLEGTAAAAAIGIFNGADIIRVHDVKEMVRVAKIADGIKRISDVSKPE